MNESVIHSDLRKNLSARSARLNKVILQVAATFKTSQPLKHHRVAGM